MKVTTRERQLDYSSLEPRTLDEAKRRRKGAKLISVLLHHLGRPSFDGLRVLDLGCSAGFISDELAAAGADVLGADIDLNGLRRARARFGATLRFVGADGEALPLAARSVDVAVVNHIYEHVVDADALLAEIRRVLTPQGLVYLGLVNKWGLVEPHYNLPGLSFIPPSAADRYLKITRRGDRYHERPRTRAGLRRMAAGLHLWDYTIAVIRQPERFQAAAELPGPARRVPAVAWQAALAVVPTYIWVASPSNVPPRGPRLAVDPTYLPPVAVPDQRGPVA